jgi:hypothetical protein
MFPTGHFDYLNKEIQDKKKRIIALDDSISAADIALRVWENELKVSTSHACISLDFLYTNANCPSDIRLENLLSYSLTY